MHQRLKKVRLLLTDLLCYAVCCYQCKQPLKISCELVSSLQGAHAFLCPFQPPRVGPNYTGIQHMSAKWLGSVSSQRL